MPGKVNPTQCEAMTMVAVHVMGSDAAIAIAGSQGNFELNVFKPVMIFNLLHSILLLSDSCEMFRKYCIDGLKPNEKKIAEYVKNSLMLITALNPVLGYDKCAQISKLAYEKDLSLKEACLELGYLSSDAFDRAMNLKKMTHP